MRLEAAEIARGDLPIRGLALEVDKAPVATGIDIAASVQTIFGGKTNDDAPVVPQLTAVAELNGPGIDSPITLTTQPGHRFQLPPLHQAGDYILQNIRLMDADAHFVQQAMPSFAAIHVSDVFLTQLRVRQLTPDELRARGISVDGKNFDVYDVTIIVALRDGQTVEVPYPIFVNKITHEVVAAPGPTEQQLPKPKTVAAPPRFQPPDVFPIALVEDLDGGNAPSGGGSVERLPAQSRATIPAAIVLPVGFGVLHQFFSVVLNVSNNAPDLSAIVLDSITATIDAPLAMRVAKVDPPVSFSQAVPILDKLTGSTLLVAQAQGSADWSLEALQPGTHTVSITVRATYRAPNQPDVHLKAEAKASIAVSDPRFQFNFVHPDNVRKEEAYTAYAFVTNTSASSQTIALDTRDIKDCSSNVFVSHICRVEGDPAPQITLAAGETKSIAFRLKTDVTGHAYAGVVAADAGISGAISLSMGVSDRGIPLSPATLVLPYYARFVDSNLVDKHLQFLGLGYSLATAPLTPQTAKLPRILRSDVFQRAQDIARAGQRIFIARRDIAIDDPIEDRDPIFNLSLDLLDNVERLDQLAKAPDLREWDHLRMQEDDARAAAASIGAEIARTGLTGGRSLSQLIDDFATATAHRSPYALALVHGTPVSGVARPYAVNVKGVTSAGQLDATADAKSGWMRTLANSELVQVSSSSEYGELAMIGRWREALECTVKPAAASFVVDLVYPDTADGAFLRASLAIVNADANTPVKITIARGAPPIVTGAQIAGAMNSSPIAQPALRVVAAAQDLHLDPDAHVVSLLLNRPVVAADKSNFSLTTKVAAAGYEQTRRDGIPGASLQDDGRIINISLDHALSKNATYVIGLDAPQSTVAPRIDNNSPGGIVVGKLLRGDSTPVGSALVQLLANGSLQYDTTMADGSFIFEHVPRDLARDILGNYHAEAAAEGKFAQVDGVVRAIGDVQRIVLQFLGRGSATGYVRYSDGAPIVAASVTGGSTVYSEFHQTTTDALGKYTLKDLPVGPLTFAALDAGGNIAYAATQIRTPGESITQDLIIQKRPIGIGFGSVRLTVIRSDSGLTVAGAHVGVFTQGYGLIDGFSDSNGRFSFTRVPSGPISVVASEFGITRESAGVDLDLRADSTMDVVLTLHVPRATDPPQVTLHGFIRRDDPAAPADRTRDVAVPNAIITIQGLAPITSAANGEYIYSGIPAALSEKKAVTIFDPTTARQGTFTLVTFSSAPAEQNFLLQTSAAQGTAKLRVRLLSANGSTVSDYRVISPGFPRPDEFTSMGSGVYELTVNVPQQLDVWAVPNGHHPLYGDQVARGSIRADFDRQISLIELRLPGQGTALTKILVRKPCPIGQTSCPDDYDIAQGMVALTSRVWSEDEQQLVSYTRNIDADPTTGIATIGQIPAADNALVETVNHPAGYAAARIAVAFDGDTRQIDLKLSSIGDVTGRVLSYDGQTPIAGATVRFAGSIANLGPVVTGNDGTFRFAGVAANQTFRVTAEVTQDGIFRTGYADGNSPKGGGPVSGVSVIMHAQASVTGTIVDAGGVAVALARYWARELAWPYRSFGSQADPLIASKDGTFVLSNIFTGPLRISAASPVHQEDRGNWQGDIGFESDNKTGVRIAIGSGGTGSISVAVVDPNNSFKRVPFTEVTLVRGTAPFDFASTDQNGLAFFDVVPADGVDYSIRATSKSVGRSGASGAFKVITGSPLQIQISLDLLGRVAGTLLDGDVTPPPPVPGAAVFLYGSINAIASTGSAGAFELNGIPEGHFRLEALDVDSGRRARSTGDLFIDKLVSPERTGIQLLLEQTATLHVKVYLPDDRGLAGVLAPLTDVKVTQRDYSREQQGNDLTFAKMFSQATYHIEARELGGDDRVAMLDGVFAPGAFAGDATLIFKTSGTVQIHVTSPDPTLIGGAHVTVSSIAKTYTVFTDATGNITLQGVTLGPIGVQVTSSNLSASASGDLVSHSTPLTIEVALSSRAAIDGFVDAESGGPSAGTAVHVEVQSPVVAGGSLRLDTRTDASGHYLFSGIPASSTRVTLIMLGPDEITIGASLSQTIPDGTTGLITMPRVKLDATPPRVLTIDPGNNANSVSPNANVTITFTEAVSASSQNTGNFKLVATDDNSEAPIAITPEIVDGLFRIRLTPVGLLKSNVVYRVFVGSTVTDLAGHPLGASVGSSFTTVNYTEPKIVRVDPSVDLPLIDGATFRLKFNKAVDASSGAITLQQLDSMHGQRTADVPVRIYPDTVDLSTIVVAPTGVAIQPSSFYRITASGVRDTQTPPNTQKEAQVFDFFSFDHVKPVVAIISPVPAGQPLVGGVAYVANVKITDDGSSASKDIQYVDWFEGDHFVVRVKAAPFAYAFAAPKTGDKYTLQASATDFSNNSSDVAAMTWSVVANNPPANVNIAAIPDSVYVGGHVDATVTFTDEGLTAAASLRVVGSHKDGTPYELDASRIKPSTNQQASRAAVDAAWPAVKFGVDLPVDLKQGDPLHFTATIVDSINQATTAVADVLLKSDAVAPRIISMTPAAETHFKYGTTYPVTVQVKDGESGIGHVTVAYEAKIVDVTVGSYDAATGVMTFTTNIAVTAKNADTRIHILATAFDIAGNSSQASTDVIYDSVNDPTVPVAEWLTPLDRAVLPANRSMSIKLRVHATDNVHVEGVRFESAAFASPVPALTTATSPDTYETPAVVNVPATGSLTITATVSDNDPAHDVVLPITIDAVPVDREIPADAAITAATASQYANQSILVTGASTRLYINVPLSLQNLIVIGGAKIGNPDRTKVDLTVARAIYVDADSSFDLTAKGFLGGWAQSEDHSTQNNSARGMTLTGDGPLAASGSYAGLAGGTTNAPYGSMAAPADFGSGGAGAATCCAAGANGGGAVALRADRIVVAGTVRADGGSGVGAAYAGSGGSVLMTARELITSPSTRITANGGDDDGVANGDAGGGGGRIAIAAAERLELFSASAEIQARGGRNGSADEGKTFIDGGAGTILLTRPGGMLGELIVSSADERHAASTHQTRGSPVAGTLAFSAVTIGPRALARFDDDFTAATTTVDPTAVLLRKSDVPAITLTTAATTTIQDTNFIASYSASSRAGIGAVVFTFAKPSVVSFVDFPAAVPTSNASIAVPFDSAPGAAVLKAVATDRAGRTAEVTVSSLAVVANAPPVISAFDVTPSQTFAGRTVTATAAASDDVAVKSLTLTSSVGTVATTSPQAFSVAIPPETTGGTNVQLTLSASDGFPGRATTTQSRSVAVLPDAVPPVVTITSPVAGTIFDVSSSVRIPIRATAVDAEVGVRQVFASIDGGVPIPMIADASTSNGWMADVAVPSVDGTQPVPKSIVVSASDYVPNTASSVPVTINVRPVFDQNGPIVAWLCPTSGAMFPSGYSVKLRVSASASPQSPDNGISSVSFYVGGDTTPIVPPAPTGNVYEVTMQMPSAANGTRVPVKVVATAIRGNVTTVQETLTVIAGTTISSDTSLISGDTRYDGQSLIVTGGKLTIDGAHTFANLAVLDGASVTHTPVNAAGVGAMTLTITGAVYVSCGGSIDVSGKGYQDAVGGYGRTWPNTTAGGSYQTSGGSHGGQGGTGGEAVAACYGSLFDPNEPGGAGGHSGDYLGNAGGGIARLTANSFVVDGSIAADGQYAGQGGSGAGAGGSIRLDAQTISGAGTIHADGAAPVNFNDGGGGGRIAIYGAVSMSHAQITAHGGVGSPSNGAAGTIFIKPAAQTFGDLYADNGTRATTSLTTLTSVSPGTAFPVVTDFGADFIKDANATLPSPNALNGIRLILNNDAAVQWPIVSNDAKLVRIAPDAAFAPQNGKTFRGIDRFNKVVLTNAHLEVADLLAIETPIARDAQSTFITGNLSPPSIDRSLISLRSGTTGSIVVGQAGAVADADKPITVLLTNSRTGQTFNAIADNVDGHFIAAVGGEVGDVITAKARDGHHFPLDSPTVTLDPLTVKTAAVTQLAATQWGTATGFVARTLAVTGRTMVVGSYPNLDGSGSAQVVLLDTTDPLHPAFKRTVNAARGAIRDIAAAGNYAFIVGDRLSTLNLDEANATPNFASDDPCGLENAIVLAATYAITAETGCANGGRLVVYDVTNPAAPRYLNVQDLLPGTVTPFTDLLLLGDAHLVALSPSTSGIDVSIIDRRDIDHLQKIAQLAIPNFDAFRGAIHGHYLYLASQTTREVVVVDVGMPSSPVIAARTTLPQAGGNVAVANGVAYVADGAAGVVMLSASDPSSISVTSSVPLGGNTFDVAAGAGAIYAATETGVAVFAATAPPLIDPNRVSITAPTAVTATVSGSADSVTGASPVIVDISASGGATLASVPVAADGSFTTTLNAKAGEVVTIRANDKNGVPTDAIAVGSVPFAPSITLTAITVPSEPQFRARTLSTDSSLLAVTGWSEDQGQSDKVALFDVGIRASPVFKRLVSVGGQVIYDFKIANGWGYSASYYFCTINLADANATRNCFNPSGVLDVAPSGNYAFVASNNQSIRVYDVTNPGNAVLLSDQGAGATFYGLQTYGSDYLIGTSPLKTNGVGHDVVVIDRHDVRNLVKVADIDIPNFDGFRGRIIGSTLYLSGFGKNVAVIDLTNPQSPVVKNVIDTVGAPHGVVAAGTTLIAADGTRGVTFVDLTGTPAITGVQAVGGSAWDALLIAGVLYVANENGLVVAGDVVAPPIVYPARITVVANNAATARIVAQPHAVDGKSPLTIEARNATSGTTIGGVAVASDGSFAATVAAAYGDSLTVKAIDGAGRSTGPIVVGVMQPPPLTVTSSLITIARNGSNSVITGAPTAIVGGQPPVTAIVSNTTTGTSTNAMVAADGSFSATLAASVGNTIAVKATDAGDRSVGPFTIGVVPATLTLNVARITIDNDAGAVAVLIANDALAGNNPITLKVTNTRTSAMTSSTTPPGISLSIAIAGAAAGDVLTIAASDASGAQLQPVTIGSVPAAVAINASVIRVGLGGAVFGSSGAVVGRAPLTVIVRVSILSMNAPVGSDGSFTAHITAASGSITATAVDAGGHETAPVTLGSIQNSGNISITPEMNVDSGFRMRNLASGGKWLAVYAAKLAESTPAALGQPPVDLSKRVVIFDTSDSANPRYVRTIDAGDYVYDASITNDALYLGTNSSARFTDLTNPNAPLYNIALSGYGEAVATIGNVLYVCNGGYVRGFDVSAPSAPTQVLASYIGGSCTSLLPYQNRWLIALMRNTSAQVPQIYIVDSRQQIGATVSVPTGISRGRISGSTLYVTTMAAGEVAIDLGAIAKPIVSAPSATAQPTHYGLDAFGAAVTVATKDAIVELDLSNPAAPVTLLTTSGFVNPMWDVRNIDGSLIGANELSLYVAAVATRPPAVDASKVAVSARDSGGSVTVSVAGSGGAVRGLPALNAIVTHASQTLPAVPVAADGSFITNLGAQPGETLTLVARDSVGRSSAIAQLGKVPSGQATAITPAMSDATFRARQLVVDGHTLIAASRIGDDGSGGSNKLILFDVASGPPAYKTTVAVGAGNVLGLTALNGWLYVLTDREFATVDIRSSVPVVHVSPDPPNVTGGSVAVNGTYAYVVANGGAASIYDVADPAAPRLFTTSSLGCNITNHVIAYDISSLVVALGDCGVWLVDVSNPFSLGVPFADGTPHADRIVKLGGRAFATDPFLGTLSEEPLMVASPIPVTVATAGAARGVDAAGTTVVVADGAAGVSLFDVSTTGAPVLKKTIPIAAIAWDVKVSHNSVYVASDASITTLNGLGIAPVIDERAIAVTTDGGVTATVAGGAAAVTGQPTLAVDLATSSGGALKGVPVTPDGTFTSVALPGTQGASVAVSAIDAANRQSTATAAVPFSNTIDRSFIDPSVTHDSYATMRRIAVDGTNLYACAGDWNIPPYWFNTDEIFVFDTSRTLASQTPQIIHAGQPVVAIAARNGWLYIAGNNDFATIEVATGAVHHATGAPWGTLGVTLIGNRAFVSAWGVQHADLQIYDVTDPGVPSFVSEQAPFDNGDIMSVKSIDAGHVAAFLPWSDHGAQVAIYDVTNVANVAIAGSASVPAATDGVVIGSRIYAFDYHAAVTIVDATDPAHPIVRGQVDTGGTATGVAVTGANEIAIADGFGVTFADITDPANPIIKGTQQVPGAPIDVLLVGKTLYIAAERLLDGIPRR